MLMLKELWARFRRLWFHPWVHWVGGKKPRFAKSVTEWQWCNREQDWVTTYVGCECGKVFYQRKESRYGNPYRN